MRAAVIDHESLRVEERPDPVPGPGEVVIASEFAGINAADLLQRRGVYPSPAGWPADIPGMEVSGAVSEVGADVSTSLLGRRVCTIVGAGAQATRVRALAAHLIEVPDGVAMSAAGGFAEAFITAYDALVLQGRLSFGQRLLVSGAAGGVGSAAVQVGHLLGAHVTAVTRSLAHHQSLRDLGADEVIDLAGVADIEPVDVVLELVGAAHLELAQRRLADFARVVVIGVAGGGSRSEVDLLNIMRTRAVLTGSTLRSRSPEEKTSIITRVTEALVSPWRRGEITVPVAATFELDDVQDAYAFFAAPGKFGKVVLATGGSTT
ncbi:MAG: zinc-binding dehydrogenase [Acidobacteriota bacterium]|nr:zinc-binding dehydrogenase [Acidobacteriota bacterium]